MVNRWDQYVDVWEITNEPIVTILKESEYIDKLAFYNKLCEMYSYYKTKTSKPVIINETNRFNYAHPHQVIFQDDFNTLNNWNIISGNWQATNGKLMGDHGIIITKYQYGDGVNFYITTKIKTTALGSCSWNTMRLLFKFVNENNYYAVILHTDGNLELAQMYNGNWYPYLAGSYIGKYPSEYHEIQVACYRCCGRDLIEIYVDGTQYIAYRAEENLLIGRKFGFHAENSSGEADFIKAEHGPKITPNSFLDASDWAVFHIYGDTLGNKQILSDCVQEFRKYTNKPIVIGEAGACTAFYGEYKQKQLIESLISNTANLDIKYIFLWIWNDFPIQHVGDKCEATYGIIRLDGTKKPAYDIWKQEMNTNTPRTKP